MFAGPSPKRLGIKLLQQCFIDNHVARQPVFAARNASRNEEGKQHQFEYKFKAHCCFYQI